MSPETISFTIIVGAFCFAGGVLSLALVISIYWSKLWK